MSLPPAMAKLSNQMAEKKQMTRSEFMRTALRRYIEELQTEDALRIYKHEKNSGKLKELKGSLTDLME